MLLPSFTGSPDLNHIYHMDTLALARALPDNSINCVVTSPPYWQQRKYGVAGEWGSEPTLAEYIHNLVTLFREIRRVLRPDGVCWLNLGDKYVGSTSEHKAAGSFGHNSVVAMKTRKGIPLSGRKESVQAAKSMGFKPKDLMLIPHRVAIALQDDGWYVRMDSVWFKPNPLPESVKDRPTRAHEYVFMLTKSPNYWYDPEPVRTPVKPSSIKRRGRAVSPDHKNASGAPGQTVHSMFAPRVNTNRNDSAGSKSRASFDEKYENESAPMANLRSVWKISPVGFKDAHFATFPPRLAEIPILTSCPPYVCPECGAPWIREVESVGGTIGRSWHDHKNDLEHGQQAPFSGGVGNAKDNDGNPYQRIDKGFHQACSCHPGLVPVPGTVFDPFMGSGTTALVALEHGRNYIGAELNFDYVRMARRRVAVAQTPGLDDFFSALATWATQFDDLPLFQAMEAVPQS